MDVIWKKKENEGRENQNKGINELKEGLKIKSNNLILEKRKSIPNKPNFLKQLSFNNNTNIITQKKPNLTIILPEENYNKTLNNYKNNLLNQTIQ